MAFQAGCWVSGQCSRSPHAALCCGCEMALRPAAGSPPECETHDGLSTIIAGCSSWFYRRLRSIKIFAMPSQKNCQLKGFSLLQMFASVQGHPKAFRSRSKQSAVAWKTSPKPVWGAVLHAAASVARSVHTLGLMNATEDGQAA